MNFLPFYWALLSRPNSFTWSFHSSSTSPVCPSPDFYRDICCSNCHVCLLQHDQVAPGVNNARLSFSERANNTVKQKKVDSQPSRPEMTDFIPLYLDFRPCEKKKVKQVKKKSEKRWKKWTKRLQANLVIVHAFSYCTASIFFCIKLLVRKWIFKFSCQTITLTMQCKVLWRSFAHEQGYYSSVNSIYY